MTGTTLSRMGIAIAPATSFIAHTPRQTVFPTTTKLNRVYQKVFDLGVYGDIQAPPRNLCGFINGLASQPFQCGFSWSCTIISTNIACVSGPSTQLTESCQDYTYAPYATFQYECSLDLLWRPLECVTLRLAEGSVTGYTCGPQHQTNTVQNVTEFISSNPGAIFSFIRFVDAWSFVSVERGAVPTDTSGFLNMMSSGISNCTNDMDTHCPQLAEAAVNCQNLNDPVKCFCGELRNTSCPGICLSGEEPGSYLRWVHKTCANYWYDPAVPGGGWVDYENVTVAAYSNLFPWPWRVEYHPNITEGSHNINSRCPSISAKLGAFAIINSMALLAVILIGQRVVINWLTRGWCGKPGSRLWPLSALLSVVFSLGANFVNATLIQHTPGFSHISVGGLALLWCARPRLAWVAAGLVNFQQDTANFFSLGASVVTAEIILQIIAAVYIGMTANFASTHHYYLKHHLDQVPNGRDALLMYVGALLWLIFALGVLFQCIWAIEAIRKVARYFILNLSRWMYGLFKLMCRKDSIADDNLSPDKIALEDLPVGRAVSDSAEVWNRMGLDHRARRLMSAVFFWMAVPFLAQWLFWAGFVRLAGDLYCPPKLKTITSVWTVGSVLGVFFGTAL